MPDTFIPQAETSGFIIQLGEWVLRTGAEQVKRWQKRSTAATPGCQSFGPSVLAFQSHQTSRRRPARRPDSTQRDLDFEITETIAMHNAEESVGVMRQLKSMGVGLSLDDFGTGYSSLSYLKRFPIDVLKIDKSFVRDIPEDANDLAIVSAIIAMSHALGLKIIAEGVETEAQWHFLRDCGTQHAQGYYFGRPLPAADIEALPRTPGTACSRHFRSGRLIDALGPGEVAEWSNALAWKASRGVEPLGSSNLPLSELISTVLPLLCQAAFFCSICNAIAYDVDRKRGKHMTTSSSLRRCMLGMLILFAFVSQETWALAGTTGGITGYVRDADGSLCLTRESRSPRLPKLRRSRRTAAGIFHFCRSRPTRTRSARSRTAIRRITAGRGAISSMESTRARSNA